MAEGNLRPPLRDLVLSLLNRYQEDLLVCPAARLYHHPYLGGLLEHTWSVTRHTLASLSVYPDLNPDLALAGAILHDLGKVKEIANPQAPDLTVSGQLLGHIVLGWEMVREEARALEFPDPNLLVQLEHIILSHHGSLEFGSPVPAQDPGSPAGLFPGRPGRQAEDDGHPFAERLRRRRLYQLPPGIAARPL